MFVGPLTILDKSALQMLNEEEFSFLTRYLSLVVPPVLIDEIVADLKLKPTERTIPENVVKALARKMANAVGAIPVHYAEAVAGNLFGGDVTMFGQVPIGDRPNAYPTYDGEGFIYDQVPEQEFWDRLASGRFSEQDMVRAAEWRRSAKAIDLEAIQRTWAGPRKQFFGPIHSGFDLALAVDRFMEQDGEGFQENMIRNSAASVGLNELGQKAVIDRWQNLDRPKFREFAPYAAYVTRLYLAFVIGIGAGVVTTRATNYIDLQYLNYVPFCMVFSSADRFHELMWSVSAGRNSFVSGEELKSDLKARNDACRNASSSASAQHSAVEYPPKFAGSIINKVWDIYIIPQPPQREESQIRTIDDLDPETQARLRKAFQEIDRRKANPT
jgi:hypothetical protein